MALVPLPSSSSSDAYSDELYIDDFLFLPLRLTTEEDIGEVLGYVGGVVKVEGVWRWQEVIKDNGRDILERRYCCVDRDLLSSLLSDGRCWLFAARVAQLSNEKEERTCCWSITSNQLRRKKTF